MKPNFSTAKRLAEKQSGGGPQMSEEAKRFFSRVGPVNFCGAGGSMDFKALNAALDATKARVRARGKNPD